MYNIMQYCDNIWYSQKYFWEGIFNFCCGRGWMVDGITVDGGRRRMVDV